MLQKVSQDLRYRNRDDSTEPHRAIKKVVMKTLGERDYAAQETMHCNYCITNRVKLVLFLLMVER